ncbi:MAG TPA: sulfur oxidation c-type cytochrome SoxX [Desulfobacterales bacterium]|nr:sulfur oxidation c-type cytochrome SoxX [Desulfobacterales bacterium]
MAMDRGKGRRKAGLWAAAVVIGFMIAALPLSARAGNAKKGEKIAKTRKLGNCVACHYLPDVESPGNIGPNLVESMQGYTMADRKEVAQWIRDARKFNPGTIMPPFGTNKILTPEQIDDLVTYLYTLKK